MRKHPFAGRHIIALDIETTLGDVWHEADSAVWARLYIPSWRFGRRQRGGRAVLTRRLAIYARAKKKNTKYAIIAHNGGKFDFEDAEQNDGAKRVVGSRLKTTIAGIPCLDTMLLMPTALGTAEDRKGVTDLSWHTLDADEFQRRCVISIACRIAACSLMLYMRFARCLPGQDEHPVDGSVKRICRTQQILPKTTGLTPKCDPITTGGINPGYRWRFPMVDANMYPGAMKNYKHPGSNGLVEVVEPKLTREGFIKGFGDRVFFIHFVILPCQTGQVDLNMT